MQYSTRVAQNLPAALRANISDAYREYLKSFESPLMRTEKAVDDFPESLLPEKTTAFDFMFWALGAEDLNWQSHSATKKRAILKRLFELFKKKGSPAGYALALELLVDKSLIKINTSPSKAFGGRSTTPEEKEAFESQYPQIRIYPFSHAGVRRTLFAGDFMAEWTRGFPAVTDAASRVGDRVTMYDPATGEEETLDNFFDRTWFEVRLKGVQTGIMPGGPFKKHVVKSNAADRHYCINMARAHQTDLERRSSVALRPSLTPMTVYYTTTAIPAYTRAMFSGDAYPACYPVNTDAEKRIFKSLRLYDPLRAVNRTSKGQQFAGAMRYGSLAPNEIELFVDMSRVRKYGVFAGSFLGWPVESDAAEEIKKMRFALNYVREAGIKGTVKTNNYKQIRTSNSILAGARLAGEYIKEA